MNNPSPDRIDHPPQDHVPLSSILLRSGQVFWRSPQLAIIPLLTTIACVGMYLVLVGGFSQPLRMAGWNPVNPAVWGNFRPMPLAIFYFASMFSATFFNVAFYHEVMRAFSGERPSLARGLRFSLSRVGPIASWTMFAWSVGMIMRLIGERFGWVARIVGVFAGFAWSVAAVFAIPVLARDGALDPMAVLRDSSTLVRRTWGGLVYGFASLAPFAFVFMLVSGVVVGVAGSAMGISPAGMTAASMVGALCFFVALAAIRDIYRCALYIYATEGVVPDPFLLSDMDAGWKIKSMSPQTVPASMADAPPRLQPHARHAWSRVWKWATVSLGTVMLVIVVGLFSFVLIFLHRLRSLPVYEGAVSRVKEAPAAIAALGTPIKEGFLFSGTFSLDDTSNDADIEFPISAPNGDAVVQVKASRSLGKWHYDRMIVQPHGGGPPIDVSEQETKPGSEASSKPAP